MVKTWKKWEDSDLAVLRRLAHEGVPACIIAEKLGRTTNAVYIQAYARGVWLNNRWSGDEVKELCASEDILTLSEVAERLDRPISSVRHKAYELGISLRDGRESWRSDEVEKLYASEGALTASEIAGKLGRTVVSVRLKAFRLGVSLRDGRRSR